MRISLGRNPEGVATCVRSMTGDATLSGFRLQKKETRVPRVARAQPRAGISQRFKRSSLGLKLTSFER
jgi:hypothetical protein